MSAGSFNQTVEMTMKKMMLAAAVLAASGSAFANGMTDKLYGVVGFQNSELDVDTSGLDSLGFSTDNDDNSFNLGLGFKVNDNFAVELGYMDMGQVLKSSASFSATTGVITGNIGNDTYTYSAGAAGSAEVKADADGWTLGAVFSLPVSEKVDVLAKAGIFKWDAKASFNASLNANETLTVNGVAYTSSAAFTVSGDLSEDGTDPYYGVGLSYDINDKFTVRADYTKYEVWDEDIDVMGAALLVKF
jgi:hypothetical protein